jgi:hypothetical protein
MANSKTAQIIVLDTPHSSRQIPTDERQAIRLDDVALGPELLSMTDAYSVALDAPFAGALVPLSAYVKDGRVSSVMIEVNRRLYMDELSGQKARNFATVQEASVGRLIVAAAEAEAQSPCEVPNS